jgi:arylsulfatase A-like enzyme
MTGCYPGALGVTRNGNARFPASDRLITRRLADVGYDCGQVGKLHLSAAQGRVEPRPDDGYRVFKWSHHPYPEAWWPTEAHDYQLWLREQGVCWDQAYGGEYAGIEARYHQTTWCANEATAFFFEHRRTHSVRDGPWLMSVNPFDPYPPFDPPPEYMARMDVDAMPLPLFRPPELESQLAFADIVHHTRTPKDPATYDARRMLAAYYAQIELIDSQIGRMLDALAATGQRENTIVLFTSDHGGMLGDHGLLKKGCRFYEGAIHVPLILSWPGRLRGGRQNDALVELTDLAPTLYEAIGMPIPDFVQGKSLLPLLTETSAPEDHRSFVRSEYHNSLHPGCV